MANFRIHEHFMDELTKKLARIQKKCNRNGCAFTFEETGEEFEKVKDKDGMEHIERFVLVNVEGKAILNDWEFAATIDKTENGNIVDKAPSFSLEVPRKYWKSSLYCEHCKTHRKRAHVYLVHNTKTNEFKQVGRQCLAEYTHGLSAELVAAIMECKTACEEAEQAWTGCGHSGWSRYVEAEKALALAFGAVRAFGYVKSDMPNSTRNKVEEYIRCIRRDYPYESRKHYKDVKTEMELHDISEETEKDLADAKKALEWLEMQEESTDYMHNMKTAICKYTEEKRMGLLISLVPTYCKAIQREIERKEREEQQAKEAKNSEYIGQVGDRVSFQIETFGILTSWLSDFGLVVLYKFTDAAGNVFIWKTSKDLDEKVVGKKMVGTVKEHKEFREVKQTALTRCKIQ